ncbi:DUF2955 domain-containing protein [Carboxylicivirga marina]|uniref:DUF2955 domain-containing protein n=1 Tax=Carboxylicivirga marina TaxID=2800988 RepID=UPI0025951781|nr:DUF2955 domain-containing protein [uncultured Carboxylicivirga sp.]
MSDRQLPYKPKEIRQMSIFRYAVGSTLIMGVAMAYAWNLSFITPILALSFIGPDAKCPSAKTGISFVLLIAITTFLGFVVSKYFIDKQAVFILIIGLSLFYIFYSEKLKGPVKTFMLISLLLMPVLSMQHIAVAYMFNVYFIIGAVITILLVWVVYLILPDKTEHAKDIEVANKKNNSANNESFDKAIQTLFVVFPIVLLFFYFGWSGSLIILMFVGLLSMNPSFNAKAGFVLIVGNLTGGVLAIIAYEILTLVPHFTFFILLTLGIGLLMAKQVFSGNKTAPLYGMAYSTFLLIIGQATTSTSDAGEKVWIRVLQIMIAVLYVVIALNVYDAFKVYYQNRKKKKPSFKIN